MISDVMDTSLLVNVVHNDFHDSDAIFEPFLKAGAEYLAMQSNSTPINGR